jgi:hypothetical protein
MGIRDRDYMKRRPEDEPEPESKFDPLILDPEALLAAAGRKARLRWMVIAVLVILALFIIAAVIGSLT